ncbi:MULTISPECIES: hypothetical protein [Halorussus]|uniref:hypothetical protein n=1 Tax=Halorussus TaxID=1070314 RepID=UPI000E215FF4|nr:MULTISPECIES: hypothetical protein [Halorussus]NHN60078.1 hypothetical protein [Halorussus sp. JP-T4]
MDPDPDAIRDRLRVVHLDEQLSLGEGAVVYAEGPETGCIGLGEAEAEAEAVGNAVAVVARYEREEPGSIPYVKAPGRVIEKKWEDDESGRFGSVRDRL